MQLAYLKKIRIIVSLLFFIITALLFIDIGNNYSVEISNTVLFFQFIPSLLKFISVFSLTSFGFIFILILTLFFGRVYCSSICPIGTLQDIVIRLTNLKKKKKKYKFEYFRPHNVLRYSILGITFLLFVLGSLFAINLIDPFSNFGRLIVHIFRPIVILVNNLISSFLELFNNFSIFPVDLKSIALSAMLITVAFISILLWLSVKHARLYCNTICPVGALLGVISKYSLFKIVVDDVNCISCGVCEKNCKANCIDSESKYIDFSRCVSCFNCFDSCPTEGLKYEINFFKSISGEAKTLDLQRRSFISQTLIYTAALTGLSFGQNKVEVYTKNTNVVNRLNPISPPGSTGIKQFTDSCTACHLCVSVCPTQVLQPSFLEYGFLNMMQPRMDNKSGFCNYDCKICGDVCPTGAIQPSDLDSKKLFQIGNAKFIKENCVVETQKTDCGACAEHCPTKAVHMIPYGKLKIPELTDEICIGCGACEFACPTIPYKAIYVEGSIQHKIAKKPEIKELDKSVDYKEDFPF